MVQENDFLVPETVFLVQETEFPVTENAFLVSETYFPGPKILCLVEGNHEINKNVKDASKSLKTIYYNEVKCKRCVWVPVGPSGNVSRNR